jgi:hypothetical protein
MDRRFTALRVIGTVFKVLAWFSLILGVLGSVGMLVLGFTLGSQEGFLGVSVGGPLAGIAMFVVGLLIAIISFLSLYAIGESIYLLLAMEDSTRRSAYLLQQQYTSSRDGYLHSVPEPDLED